VHQLAGLDEEGSDLFKLVDRRDLWLDLKHVKQLKEIRFSECIAWLNDRFERIEELSLSVMHFLQTLRLISQIDFPRLQTRQQCIVNLRLLLVQNHALFLPVFQLELDLLLVNDFVHIVVIFVPNEVEFVMHQDWSVEVGPC